MPDPETLSVLRKRIASLQALPCRLAHERVIQEDGMVKRRSQGIGLDPIPVRIGLCPAGIRSHQLACAHTMARHVLDALIGNLATVHVLDGVEASRMREELGRIAHAIHMTDWQKSDTEIRYALLAEKEAGSIDQPSASLLSEQAQLDASVDRHQTSVDELRRMRDMLLARLDECIRGRAG